MPRPRSEEAKRKVFDSARCHIQDSGVLDFTVEAIAKHSGVAKTTIYRHWDSAAELLHDTVASLIEPFQTPDTGSLRGDLIELSLAGIQLMNKPVMYKMMAGMVARSAEDPALRALKNRLIDERHKPIVNVIERAIERGELPADLDRAVAVDVIEGPFLVRRLVRGETLTMEHAEQVVDMILDGLRRG